MKLTFMGTAGARTMVGRQLAASGGLYLQKEDARICLDPGPGAIVQYARRKVDLTTLDAIVISHRHIDHSGDANAMVEAMTEGGYRRRGRLFCPADGLDEDPVVLRYLRPFLEEVIPLEPETAYEVKGLKFSTSPRHVHQVETFGFRFGDKLGVITDSLFYEGIVEQHRADVMIIHMVLMHCRSGIQHLCLADAERIIHEARPRLAVLTHYGMTVWRAHPWELAAELSQRLGTEVRAARDGMTLEI
jgi:phosphoribosyl 1,2-cyclic phosphodiesterase